MAELNSAFNCVCKTFKFDKLNKHQQKAIELFINQKRDIVVNLPTGYGKSIIYQALALIFDHVTNTLLNNVWFRHEFRPLILIQNLTILLNACENAYILVAAIFL